jgi:hypothetical protein
VSTAGSSQPEDDFYDAAPIEPHSIFQGEILVEVPLLLVKKEKCWLLLRTLSGRTIHEALKGGGIGGTVKVLDSNKTAVEWRNAVDGDSAVSYLTKRPVLVLSQTCDIENKDFVQVAPIYAADAGDVDKLKAGKDFYSAFYLKAHPPQIANDSYADLERMQAVHKSYIKRLDEKLHFRIKDHYVRELQYHLTRYFGRPNSFDSRADKVPRTDTYLCVDCFYFDGVASAVMFQEGERFRECEKCLGGRWVRKGP